MTALVTEVTEGGRSNARRRALAIGLVGAAVVAGGAITGVKLLGSHGAAPADAPMTNILVEKPEDAASVVDGFFTTAIADAAALDAAVSLRDASRVAVIRDARVALAHEPDAGALPIDAAALIEVAVPDAAPPPDGLIAVKNDTWCDVFIDGQKRGRAAASPFPASAGKHVVRCEQEGLHEWHHDVVVVSNQTVTTEGVMLASVTVHFDVAATLDGKPYAAGETVPVKRGRVLIEANGLKKYWTPSAPCTIRDKPELDCYETHR